MRVKLALSLLIVFLLAACGASSSQGLCGDGKCDAVEQANPKLCPQDCTIPMGASTPAGSQSGSDYAFHINFQMDESVSCPGAKCDNAYIPHMVLYFRGNVNAAADGPAAGNGTMYFIGVDPCKTLMPDVSSCNVSGASSGKFTITGRMQNGKLEMTLHLSQMPTISVTMVSQYPLGSVTIPLDATYQEEMKQVFSQAGIFEKTFSVSPEISTSDSAATFEGSYTFGGARTLHGFGGLIFISPDMPMPDAVH